MKKLFLLLAIMGIVVIGCTKEVIISDANNTFNIPAEGGIAVISYKTTVDCEVIIPEEAKDWITIAPATRGLVSESITLVVAENTTNSARSTLIKVVSKDNPDLVVEYTINQEQRCCFLYYTSSDCKMVTPYCSSSFDATITSNSYKDGVGVIEFNAPITLIGESAFKGCSSLTSVTIPDSVTAIGEDAFYDCSSLQEFKGKFASEDGRCLIIDGVLNSFAPEGLTEYNIPESVTEIGSFAFAHCESLTSITIPESVTAIGSDAFFRCYSLTSVTIGDSVTTIGEDAFYECSSLTSVIIGDSVTTIGSHAFYRCSSLIEVYCKPTTPPAGGLGMFSYTASGCKIYVPTASVEAYKSASNWSNYASDIVGYDF